jgi:hypothetical protein
LAGGLGELRGAVAIEDVVALQLRISIFFPVSVREMICRLTVGPGMCRRGLKKKGQMKTV